MKRKDVDGFHGMSLEELVKQDATVRGKLEELLLNRGSRQVKNVREAAGLRKKLAVILTIRREKEMQK